MPKLRNRIVRYLIMITALVSVLILITVFVTRTASLRLSIRDDAQILFSQIERILSENEKDLEGVREDYSATYENKARAAAYMIDGLSKEISGYSPDVARIAELLEVDEIHLFDGKGVIFASTVPDYIGVSMDDGEQISFFKPMLKDKSLFLIQDIEENSVKHKRMQYSAVWNDGGDYIVQIGMKPDAVTNFTKKNSLSYIFSILQAGADEELYAVDPESGLVKGSTLTQRVGSSAAKLGLPKAESGDELYATYSIVNGERSYCVCTMIGETEIIYVLPGSVISEELIRSIALIAASMIFIATLLVMLVMLYIDRYVIRNIKRINGSLEEISRGNLSAQIEADSIAEFAMLSGHINDMMNSLLSTTDMMSYIINKANLLLGVYAYNPKMKRVRFTEYIPYLLNLDKDEMATLASDYHRFESYIKTLQSDQMDGDDSIFRLTSNTQTRYIRIDEAMRHNDTIGIVIDMTDEIEKRRRLETERDMDLLTDMLNRRGLKERMNIMFRNPDELGYGALIMIDADGLKSINDTYGHRLGDRYLKSLSNVLVKLGSRRKLSARMGGDEFVVLIYGYSSERDLMEDINAFIKMQDMVATELYEGKDILVRFSMGYALIHDEKDPAALLKIADDMMYKNKRGRKGEEETPPEPENEEE